MPNTLVVLLLIFREAAATALPAPPSAPPSCVDTDNGATDPYGDTCADYRGNPGWCGNFDDNDFFSMTMCCTCINQPPGSPPPPAPPTAPPTSPGACVDTENGATDPFGDTCADYVGNLGWCGNYDDNDFTSEAMCCACKGGTNQPPSTPPPPVPPIAPPAEPGTCVDTDGDARDPFGDGCTEGVFGSYTDNPQWCGAYQDEDFDSVAMCCVCAPDPPSPPAVPPTCVDIDYGATDPFGDGCTEGASGSYTDFPSWCGNYDDFDFDSVAMCCACGGGVDKPPSAPPAPAPPIPPPALPGTVCVDSENGATDPFGDTCADYVDFPGWCGNYDDGDFTSEDMCCACGGGVDQVASPLPPAPPTPPPAAPGTCVDTNNGATDPFGDGCTEGAAGSYADSPFWCGTFNDEDFTSETMCCACGGGTNQPPAPPTPPIPPPFAPGTCVDSDNGATDPFGDTCADYVGNPGWCGNFDDVDFFSMTMCCACAFPSAPPSSPPSGECICPTPEPTPEYSPPSPPPTSSGESCGDPVGDFDEDGFFRLADAVFVAEVWSGIKAWNFI